MPQNILIFLLSLIYLNSYGQNEYKRLMDSAVFLGYPVLKVPLNFLGLSREHFELYAYNLQDVAVLLDTVIVGEIISNSQDTDVRRWHPQEIRTTVLIKNAKSNISNRRIKNHFAHLPLSAHKAFHLLNLDNPK